MNLIKNNPITIEDIKIGETIYGPDVGNIKGKTTRATPNSVIEDNIEIPEELKEKQRYITLCIDKMFVNRLAFFTTISQNIMYRTAEAMRSQNKEEYLRLLRNIIRIYEQAGFQIPRIHADNKFKSMADALKMTYQ